MPSGKKAVYASYAPTITRAPAWAAKPVGRHAGHASPYHEQIALERSVFARKLGHQ